MPRAWPGALVVLFLLLTGLAIYDDYGVSYDEAGMRQIGAVNLAFIRTGNFNTIDHFSDKDHGPAFEIPLKWTEEVLGITGFGSIIRYRHLCSYLFYLIGLWCGYRLALRLFGKQWIALLGLAMLALQPRIFAHAFFNSKDVPFLSALLIALNAVSSAFARREKIYLYALAGAACGYATGIRTMGLLPVMLTCVLLILDLKPAGQAVRGKILWSFLMFSLSAAAALYVCWPALWYSPLRNLAYALIRTSRYSAWGGRVLFNGHEYAGTELPWYYIPEWFCMSMPVAWLLLGGGGIFLAALGVIRRRRISLRTPRQKMLLICAACFALPVMAVMVFRSVVYDDWRHLYFIYPPFVMLALYGVERLSRTRTLKMAIIAACGIQAACTAVFMVQAHPYQQVYFNALAPHSPEYLRRHFDYEYWGTSYKEGLEYLLRHDKRDTVPVVMTGSPLRHSSNMLLPVLKQRIRWTEDEVPGAYLLTTYRLHPGDYPYPKVWGIQVGGSTVMQIYRVDTSGIGR